LIYGTFAAMWVKALITQESIGLTEEQKLVDKIPDKIL